MSPDDVGGHLEDPQTLNLYSYVGNNPLSRTDPSGHGFYQSCDKGSATGYAGVALTAKSAYHAYKQCMAQ